MPARPVGTRAVTEAWIVVGVVGAATVGIKAVGPVFLGGRPLPPRLQAVVRLLAPAVLAALVATGALATDQELVLDARLVGLGAAVVALLLRAPVLVVVVAAAAATALARFVGFA
jgi:branched-subunit amino acid transport protein